MRLGPRERPLGCPVASMASQGTWTPWPSTGGWHVDGRTGLPPPSIWVTTTRLGASFPHLCPGGHPVKHQLSLYSVFIWLLNGLGRPDLSLYNICLLPTALSITMEVKMPCIAELLRDALGSPQNCT